MSESLKIMVNVGSIVNEDPIVSQGSPGTRIRDGNSSTPSLLISFPLNSWARSPLPSEFAGIRSPSTFPAYSGWMIALM